MKSSGTIPDGRTLFPPQTPNLFFSWRNTTRKALKWEFLYRLLEEIATKNAPPSEWRARKLAEVAGLRLQVERAWHQARER